MGRLKKNDAWVPEEFVLGVRKLDVDNPLGYPMPLGDGKDNARKKSVLKWAKKAKNVTAKNQHEYISTFKNVPRDGFEIIGTSRRWSSRTNNVVFKTKDPVGYVFELQAENLYEIIEESDIINGKIQGEYVLIRDGTNTSLCQVGSKKYSDAMVATEAKIGDLSMSDIELGYKVAFQREIVGTYLGRWNTVNVRNRRSLKGGSWRKPTYQRTYKRWTDINVKSSRKHAILLEDGSMMIHSSLKPGIILDDSETWDYQKCADKIFEFEKKINPKAYNSAHRGFKDGTGSTYNSIFSLTRDKDSVRVENRTLIVEDGYGNRRTKDVPNYDGILKA